MMKDKFEDHVNLDSLPDRGKKLYGQISKSLNKYLSLSDLNTVTTSTFFPETAENIIVGGILSEKMDQVLQYSIKTKKLGLFLNEALRKNKVCLDDVTESFPSQDNLR